jgi:hypothetical protein
MLFSAIPRSDEAKAKALGEERAGERAGGWAVVE